MILQSVYPRACGGTTVGSSQCRLKDGLSPRLRGNRRPCPQCPLSPRSIPAPAGEPMPSCAIIDPGQVYPRACGGTHPLGLPASHPNGLSPRLRGNLDPVVAPYGGSGSIPAPAGEPFRITTFAAIDPVYPRACGGTTRSPSSTNRQPGLSPRLRGNPARRRLGWRVLRSIPAPAGEPRVALPMDAFPGVYPRACGGTPFDALQQRQAAGLSPRLRGNRVSACDLKLQVRSIPAPAGEPRRHRGQRRHRGVYPRACGGTS